MYKLIHSFSHIDFKFSCSIVCDSVLSVVCSSSFQICVQLIPDMPAPKHPGNVLSTFVIAEETEMDNTYLLTASIANGLTVNPLHKASQFTV